MENEFKCECISTLDEFTALVNQLDAVDPVFCAVHSGQPHRLYAVPSQLQECKIAELLPKLDALADLLAATADGLAAESDLRAEAVDEIGFKPTIH